MSVCRLSPGRLALALARVYAAPSGALVGRAAIVDCRTSAAVGGSRWQPMPAEHLALAHADAIACRERDEGVVPIEDCLVATRNGAEGRHDSLLRAHLVARRDSGLHRTQLVDGGRDSSDDVGNRHGRIVDLEIVHRLALDGEARKERRPISCLEKLDQALDDGRVLCFDLVIRASLSSHDTAQQVHIQESQGQRVKR